MGLLIIFVIVRKADHVQKYKLTGVLLRISNYFVTFVGVSVLHEVWLHKDIEMRITYKMQGHLLMFVVATVFGVNFVVSKSLLAEDVLTPGGLSLARMLFAVVAFWSASLFVRRERVPWRDLAMLFLGSLFAVTLNQGVCLFALEMTSAIDGSIITTSTPMIAMLLAAVYLREPITWRKFMGVVVGAAGAVLLVLSAPRGGTEQDSSWLGNVLMLCSSLSYACYLVIIKPVVERYSAVTVMKWMFLFAAMIMAPLFMGELCEAAMWREPLTWEHHGRLAYVLTGATFLTYLLVPMAQRRIRPTTIGMYNYLQPLTATTLTVWLGLDQFTWVKAACAVLIFAGVYMVTTSRSRHDTLTSEGN